MARCARSLVNLPSDIMEIIAKYLPPYDVLHLSSTCKPLRPIFHDKSVWLHVSDAVSYSRPMPYTANEAQNLAVSDLHHACLRAERVAKKWANPEILPSKRPPVRICFPDSRVVSYFAFIPGFRHLMVYDVCNSLSCWTVDGKCLAKWRVFGHAILTRWKPLDEFESAHWGLKKNQRAIEITVESPRQPNSPTRCDYVLLCYSADEAKFTQIYSFIVPAPFEPFTSLSLGEFYGALVIIPSGGAGPNFDHIGIYLSDRETKRAICVDTGLSPQTFPQALASSQYMVLYRETRHGAHTYMYETSALRAMMNLQGLSQDDPQLDIPIHLPPCEARIMPFTTVAGPSCERKQGERELALDSEGENGHADFSEEAGNNEINMDNNWDWYPIIIPKWTTLRENLRRHRTRSIMTFSRSPSEPFHDIPFDEQDWLDIDEQFHPMDATNGGLALPNAQGNGDGIQQLNGVTTQQVQQLNALLQNLQNVPHTPQALYGWLVNVPQDLQDVLAMFLPVPEQDLQLLATLANDAEEGIDAGTNNEDVLIDEEAQDDEDNPPLDPDVGHVPQAALPPLPDGFDFTFDSNVTYLPPPPLTTITHHYFEYESFPQPSTLRRTLIAEVPLRRPQNVRMFRSSRQMTATNVGPEASLDEAGENESGANGVEPPVLLQTDAENDDIDIDEEIVFEALDNFVQDPFGGSPVVGYGGRCAIWVEEHEKEYKQGEPRPRPTPVLKIATFPSFEKASADGTENVPVFVHPELETARGKVGTLVVPDCVDLDRAYSFDLDDMRGVVGIATSLGEIWLIDYS